MADDGATIRIDPALTSKLQAAADAAGESFDVYVRHALETFAGDETDWDEIDRICDETIAKGDGIPFEDLRPWLQSWGKPDRLPRPK